MSTTLPKGQQDLLLALFKNKCAYCSAAWEVWDHIEPWATGGETSFNNIVPACKSCNYSKGTKHFEQWAEATGRRVKAAVYDVRAVGDYNCELSLVGEKLAVKRVGTSPVLGWILRRRPVPTYVSPKTMLRLQKAKIHAGLSTSEDADVERERSLEEPQGGPTEFITANVKYIPWTDGQKVGYRIEGLESNYMEYLYFSPIEDVEGEGPSVNVVRGKTGKEHTDQAICYFDILFEGMEYGGYIEEAFRPDHDSGPTSTRIDNPQDWDDADPAKRPKDVKGPTG